MKQKITLVVAVAVGLLAALLTRTYLAAKDAEIERQKAQFRATHRETEVLCFARDVPSGTVLAKSDLGSILVPEAGLRGQALSPANYMDVVGRKIVIGHREGDVVFWADVEGGNPGRGGLSADVKKGWRAISINASGAAAVSGMIRPNDHVDVIGTFEFPKKGGEKGETDLVSLTVLQDVLVLATGRETAKTAAQGGFGVTAPSGYSTVTLQVLPREAEILAFAEQIKGRLYLSLRNRNEPGNAKTIPQIDYTEIKTALEGLNRERQFMTNGR